MVTPRARRSSPQLGRLSHARAPAALNESQLPLPEDEQTPTPRIQRAATTDYSAPLGAPKLALPDDIDAVGLMQPALTNKVSDLLSSPDLALELVRVLELHGKVTSVVLAFLLRDIQLLRTCSLCCTRDLLW